MKSPLFQCARILFILINLLFSNTAYSSVVQYNLDIAYKTVNYTGKDVQSIAIDDSIPGPAIEAVVGDVLEVTFNNKLSEETSIHWHGVLLPNDQDGVPYLTTPPIQPGASFTYSFPIKHSGTYWYHSHTGLQEQRGVYGSLIFHPEVGERVKSDQDYVIIFSDWTDENPSSVLAHLKKDGDWYALKKRSVQSWDKVIANGKAAIRNRLRGAWIRMGPMDISDVGYDAFLANGQKQSKLDANAGDVIKLRLINAAASSYFVVEFSAGPMTIVAADGVDVQPVQVQRLRMAIAETYDVIIKVKEKKSYELRATAEDGTGYSSVFLGSGDKVLAPDTLKPNLLLMNHGMNMMNDVHHDMETDMSMQPNNKGIHMHESSINMDDKKDSVIEYMTDYGELRSLVKNKHEHDSPDRKVVLNLTGSMERYTWSFNNKTLSESDKILIKKGEIVRFVLINQTMMHHPIHLHGHFFRVLNGQGEWSPLKHTVNVPPMDTVEIEFEANEEKDWFLHCHNLYHMKVGMARFVSYQETTQATEETFNKLGHDNWYYIGDVSAFSQMTAGRLNASNTRNALEVEYDYNYEKEYDMDILYLRNQTRFLDIYAGGNLERVSKYEKADNTLVFGLKYVLPMLIEMDLRIDTQWHPRLGCMSSLQLTERGRFEWMVNTDREFRFKLSYELTKNFLISGAYDSGFKWGGGIRINF